MPHLWMGTLCSCGENRHFSLPQYVDILTHFTIIVFSAKIVSQKWLHFHPTDFMKGTFLLSVFPNRPGFQPSLIAQPCCSHRLSAFAQAPICIRLFGFVCSLWHFLLSHKAAAIILGVKGPLGMPGLRLPGPLSQHVFVTGTWRKHKLTVATVIWSMLRETSEHDCLQVVKVSSVDRYYRYVRF